MGARWLSCRTSSPSSPCRTWSSFPRMPLPLHIFEPRYRAMVRDAVRGARLIGMVLLRGDWERDYVGTPAVFGMGTVGELVRSDELPDGRFNIVLRGVREFVIHRELARAPYREAVVSWRDAPTDALPAPMRSGIGALVAALPAAHGSGRGRHGAGRERRRRRDLRQLPGPEPRPRHGREAGAARGRQPGRAGEPPGRRPGVPARGAASRPRGAGRSVGPTEPSPTLATARIGVLGCTTRMQVESPRLSILERLYLPEIVRGVTVTSGHFARNLCAARAASVRGGQGPAGDGDGAVSGAAQGLPGGLSGRASADPQARRLGALHLVLPLRDRLPGEVHPHRGGRASRTRRSRSIPCATRSTRSSASTAACASRPARATRSAWTPTCIRASGATTATTSSRPSRCSWSAREILESRGRDALMEDMLQAISRGGGGGRGGSSDPLGAVAAWAAAARRIGRRSAFFLGVGGDRARAVATLPACGDGLGLLRHAGIAGLRGGRGALARVPDESL